MSAARQPARLGGCLAAALLLAACAVLARASDAPFFFNNVTGSSTWVRPASMPYFSDEARAAAPNNV